MHVACKPSPTRSSKPPASITQGGPATDTTNLHYYIHQTAFQAYDIGRASAMSVIVLAATILIATVALHTISSSFADEGTS